jgi:hypothetical protein
MVKDGNVNLWNRDKANDLTQDMYVKLHDCTKDINEWYI